MQTMSINHDEDEREISPLDELIVPNTINSRTVVPRPEKRRRRDAMIGRRGFVDEEALSERYPIEITYSLKRSLPYLFACIVLWCYYLVAYDVVGGVGEETFMQWFLFLVTRLSIVAFALRLIYCELYRRSFTVTLEGYRLLITRGVAIQTQGSLPLLPVTEIYIRQTPLDALFGLYQVHVLAAIDPTHEFGMIEGLSRDNAIELHRLLSQKLHEQVAPAFAADGEHEVARYFDSPTEYASIVEEKRH